jgi:hypothetical protein
MLPPDLCCVATHPEMSSYYGDKPRDVPSWDSLDRGDEDELIRSEVNTMAHSSDQADLV